MEKILKDRYPTEKDNSDDDDDDDDMDEDEDINVFIEEDNARKGFEEIEKMVGASDEEAKDTANRTVEDMKKVSRYPSDGRPETKEPEEIMDILNELDEMFDSDEEN